MADDDREDCLIARLAFERSAIEGEIYFVNDGRELIDYLKKESAPHPDLILLDLNMPRMDGREALRKIKSDPGLKDIPIVILTTSRQEKDVKYCLESGAREFKTKPIEFDEWVEVIATSIKTHCTPAF
jgi:CheY-like chemotaxis protein